MAPHDVPPADRRDGSVPDNEDLEVVNDFREDAESDAGAAQQDDQGGGQEVTDARQQELDQARDRILRLQAELENLRKRTRREMAEQIRYACLPLIRDLLPVMDNIVRAIEAAGNSGEEKGLLDGVKMVQQHLQTALTDHHCTEIESLHKPFDPHLHQAISQQPSAEFPPGTVLAVPQTGYQLHDRIVRPSQVIVSTAPPEGAG